MEPIKTVDKKAEALKNKILSSDNIPLPNSVQAYYVSANGSDLNDGKSPEFPWKTLLRVNSAVNRDNKKRACVCFKRGEIFRGQLQACSNVAYTAYGAGEKPVICGSGENGAYPDKWRLCSEGKNVWEYEKELTDVGSVFFNGGEGYAVKLCPDISDGKYEYGIEKLENNQFLSSIPAADAVRLNNNTAVELKGKLYLRCDAGNPGEVYSSIEFSERSYIITIPYYSENILIDNLAVRFGGAHGIGGGFTDNLTVQNCEVGFIGGGIQSYIFNAENNIYSVVRYGNGVELHSYCSGYTVRNCWVHDIYDAGLTHQQGENHSVGLLFKDVSYVGNLIENCIYSIEYFAKKSRRNGATVLMENIYIADNIMRNAGCGFGSQRTMLKNGWNMGNHINGWQRSFNLTNGNFVIENNIFDRVLKSDPERPAKQNTSLILASAGSAEWLPMFRNNTYIIEKGNQLAYVGLNLADNASKIPYVYAAEGVSAENVFADSSGKIILIG